MPPPMVQPVRVFETFAVEPGMPVKKQDASFVVEAAVGDVAGRIK
jgi:hypothetical protein